MTTNMGLMPQHTPVSRVLYSQSKKSVLLIRKLATKLDAIFYNFESIGGSGGGNVPVDMRFIV